MLHTNFSWQQEKLQNLSAGRQGTAARALLSVIPDLIRNLGTGLDPSTLPLSGIAQDDTSCQFLDAPRLEIQKPAYRQAGALRNVRAKNTEMRQSVSAAMMAG